MCIRDSLITDDDIIICDPEAEYFALVQRLGGQVIRLSPTGKGIDGKPQYVNPMDINLNYSEEMCIRDSYYTSLVAHDMASGALTPRKPKCGDPDYYSCNEGESL